MSIQIPRENQPRFISIVSKPIKVVSFLLLFLSSANEVSTEPTCQFLSFRLSVCLFGLFIFKASNWLIYWLLTVVLAPYLSD